MATKRRMPPVDAERSEQCDGLKHSETATAAMASAIDVGARPERRFNPDLVEKSFLFHLKGHGGMSPSQHGLIRLQNRSPAPLIDLIVEVLFASFSYQMSEEFAALLEQDIDLLAALQQLVFAVLKQQST